MEYLDNIRSWGKKKKKTMDWKYQSETCHRSYAEAKTWHKKWRAAFRVAFSFSYADFFSSSGVTIASPLYSPYMVLPCQVTGRSPSAFTVQLSPAQCCQRSSHKLSVLHWIAATVTSLCMSTNISNSRMFKKVKDTLETNLGIFEMCKLPLTGMFSPTE